MYWPKRSATRRSLGALTIHRAGVTRRLVEAYNSVPTTHIAKYCAPPP